MKALWSSQQEKKPTLTSGAKPDRPAKSSAQKDTYSKLLHSFKFKQNSSKLLTKKVPKPRQETHCPCTTTKRTIPKSKV